MVCSKCNSSLTDTMRFCGNCGAPVTSPAHPETTPAMQETETVPQAPCAVPAEDMPTYTPPFAEETSSEMPIPVAVKAKKPVGWIVTAVVAVVAILAVGAYFLWRFLSASPLEGTWRVSVDLRRVMSLAETVSAEQIQESLESMYGITEEVDVKQYLNLLSIEEPLTVYLRFEKDEVDVVLNLDEIGSAVSSLYGNILDYIEDVGFYEFYKMAGMGEADVDAMLGASGMDEAAMLSMMRLAQSQIKLELSKGLETIASEVDGRNYTVYSAGYRFEDGKLELTEIPGVFLAVEIEGNTLKFKPTALLQEEVVTALNSFVPIEKAELPQ